MTALNKCNVTMPAKKSEIFLTYANNQAGVLIQAYETGHVCTKDNNLLSKFKVLESLLLPIVSLKSRSLSTLAQTTFSMSPLMTR